MITCKELRQRARNSLDNRIFGSTWLFALLACAIIGFINGTLGATGFLSVVVLVFGGCLEFGLCAYFLNNARSQNKGDLKQLFNGFTNNISKNIVAGLLVAVFTALWSILFVIPGIVKSYAYSMTFYIMNDNPNLSASEAIKESQRMMKGYKMKAFLLDLSFIGWLFVGALCCGIGTLWVAPYMTAAKTELYEHIRANAQNAVNP